jgi:ribosomal protein L37E
MSDCLRDKEVDSTICKETNDITTKCCGGKRVWHKKEFVCSSCGMPYTMQMHEDKGV